MEEIDRLLNRLADNPEALVVAGVGAGVLLLFAGMASILRDRNPAADRMAATMTRSEARYNKGILRGPEFDPKGIMRSFVPTDLKERTRLQQKLARAGFPGATAMRNFTLIRIFLGLVMPSLFLLVIILGKVPGVWLPFDLAERVSHLSNLRIMQILSVLVALGYYLPLSWLNSRESERKLKIEESFPNALDLMQISVEAGLGFDAAMTRVGNELATVSPDIAFEFLTVQRQVAAGRARDVAMRDMAQRTGVEVVRSFSNVVQQSMQFGTSMSDALATYSKEMREYREMRAQEMANKLPVKMSAVLASLMLPALILLTVGPVLIRYIRFFGG